MQSPLTSADGFNRCELAELSGSCDHISINLSECHCGKRIGGRMTIGAKSQLHELQAYKGRIFRTSMLFSLLLAVFFLGSFAFSIFLQIDPSQRWIIQIGAFCVLGAVAFVWERR